MFFILIYFNKIFLISNIKQTIYFIYADKKINISKDFAIYNFFYFKLIFLNKI